MDSTLGDLRSRLSMTDVEVQVKTSEAETRVIPEQQPLRVIPEASAKKSSRKSNKPISRSQRRGQQEESVVDQQVAAAKSLAEILRTRSELESSKAMTKLTAPAAPGVAEGASIMGLPPPPPGTGFKSYSDYMRSLAAKYNNNE